MAKWRVHVSYWSGFTKDREWHESARNLFEAQGWTDIRFRNPLAEPGFVPWSSGVDADEIDFIVNAEKVDREAVQQVLQLAGIQHTAYVTIEECKAE